MPLNEPSRPFSASRRSNILVSAVWVAFYVVLWLLQQLSCELGLPSNCRRALEPMEVLTELPFLLAFALGQVGRYDVLSLSSATARLCMYKDFENKIGPFCRLFGVSS